MGVLGLLVCLGQAGVVQAAEAAGEGNGFSFVQLSDTHWGYNDVKVNPNFATTLKLAVDQVNRLQPQPDFIIFTGDLTHTTPDAQERRKRLEEFRTIIGALKVKDVRFMPGEHDAALDRGAVYQSLFGKTAYSFDHKGVHFIALDNVSDPSAVLGPETLAWLSKDLQPLDKNQRIIVFAHRPLFDLMPTWDWATRDSAQALKLFAPYKHVTVFYGHIHQYNLHQADGISQYAARGLMYPLPAPGSVPKKAPVAWDPAFPYAGLGYRQVSVQSTSPDYQVVDYAADQTVPVVAITAKKFEFLPAKVTLKLGVPVILELTSLDVDHGFSCPDLNIRADVHAGKYSQIRFTPQKAGSFSFLCDVFCGEGHEGMTGTITVEK
jgi:3',5'-cyclic AMP phosphodiesterase CpdA